MGYLQQWRQNLAALVAIAVLAGLVALAISLAHRHAMAQAKAAVHDRFVTFVVTGAAPDGVVVTAEEAGVAAAVVARHARLPFRARISTASGSPSYGFQVELRGAGRIRCTIRIGTVAEVREASGLHGICTPAVSRGRFGSWVAG